MMKTSHVWPDDWPVSSTDWSEPTGEQEGTECAWKGLSFATKKTVLPTPNAREPKMIYRIGPDFRSYSRRVNRRIVNYVTVDATQKTDEKTTKMVFHLTEISLSPGSLKSVYEKALCVELAERGPQPSIVRLICVYSRSFAAKKKLSSKPNGGHSPSLCMFCFQGKAQGSVIKGFNGECLGSRPRGIQGARVGQGYPASFQARN